MNYRPTTYDVAGHFKCSRDAVIDFIRREYDLTYLEFRKVYGGKIKLRVAEKCRAMAEAGNTEMIKFWMINVGGWTNGYNQTRAFEEEEKIDELEWVDP